MKLHEAQECETSPVFFRPLHGVSQIKSNQISFIYSRQDITIQHKLLRAFEPTVVMNYIVYSA